MATETADGDAAASERSSHLRSILVATVATLSGVGGGVAAWQFAAGPNDQIGIAALGAALLVTYAVLAVAGVDVRDFGTKDNLYVAFMTFSMWFVTWGLLLSAQVA